MLSLVGRLLGDELWKVVVRLHRRRDALAASVGETVACDRVRLGGAGKLGGLAEVGSVGCKVW